MLFSFVAKVVVENRVDGLVLIQSMNAQGSYGCAYLVVPTPATLASLQP